MSTAIERPTLPKGWKWWNYPIASRETESLHMRISNVTNGPAWKWRADVHGARVTEGTAPDASSAAEAAERAVVEWARGLIAEVEG